MESRYIYFFLCNLLCLKTYRIKQMLKEYHFVVNNAFIKHHLGEDRSHIRIQQSCIRVFSVVRIMNE